MLATAVIEVLLAIYSFSRYRRHPLGGLVTLTLICLGAFQIAEFNICEGLAVENLWWTKLGLSAITLLPPLGLHLVEIMSGTSRRLTVIGYICAAVYIVMFVGSNALVQGGNCVGNYVIIYTSPMAFGIYYIGFLLIAVLLAVSALREKLVTNPARRQALAWLVVGYLSFMVPMGIVYMVAPHVRSGVPSIMCGFAVTLAIILGLRVLPLYNASAKTSG